MKIPFVNYRKNYLSHKEEYDKAREDCRLNGRLILQKDVEEFERNLAKYLGVNYVVGVNSGTDALMIALRCLGIEKGDEVVTSSHTFWATIEAILHCGAKPVLTEVDEYGLMDVYNLEQKINTRTKCIIPVHISGNVCDMLNVKKLAGGYEIPIIEDSCQAIGASPLGGMASCYSFYPAKILGSDGDGGAIATNSEDIVDMAMKLRNHGGKPEPKFAGYTSRLGNVRAAELNVKLKYLPDILKRRKEVAFMYDEGLHLNKEIQTPKVREIYQDYIIKTDQIDALDEFLKWKEIETMRNEYHFPEWFPKNKSAIEFESKTLRIPCNETLENEDVDYVIKSINEFFQK